MITGGGTGGHVSPALAILEELRRRDPQLLVQWLGRKGGMEARAAREQGVPFRALPVAPWPRHSKLRRGWVALKLAVGAVQAALCIRRFRPQLMAGVGGYVSLPALWAAQRLGVPTVIHEQNKRLGMANRFLAPHATRVFLSYEATAQGLPEDRTRVVGNPVRAGFAKPPDKAVARERFGLDPAAPVVLVAGGSQGAHSINEAVAGALGRFERGRLQLLWMTGEADYPRYEAIAEQAAPDVRLFRYISDMPGACAAADLIVCRAGASTSAELAMLGRAAILVPYPHAAENHQEENARAFEEAGAAVLLHDADCTADTLADHITGLLAAPDRLDEMARAAAGLARPLAAEAIVEEIITLVFGEAQGA